MKKKEKFTLTAKQRKELRQKEEQKKNPSPVDEEPIKAQEEKQAVKQKRSLIIRVVALSMAVLIAVGCIAVAVWLSTLGGDYYNGQPSMAPAEGETKDIVYPVAVINLSNKKQIEIKLNYAECPAAVANFVYLAENDFYKDTMFHNSDFGFLAFSGYENPNKNKAENEDYVIKLKGFSSKRGVGYGQSNFKLGYRLASKKTSPTGDKSGYLAFMSGTSTGAYSSSTSYLLIHDKNAQLNAGDTDIGPGSTTLSSISYMGEISSESMDVIKEISKMEKSTTAVKNIFGSSTFINGWRYPKEYQSVMIKSIEISYLDKTLKKNILENFEEFVLNPESEIIDAIKANSSNPDIWQKTIMGNN